MRNNFFIAHLRRAYSIRRPLRISRALRAEERRNRRTPILPQGRPEAERV